MEKYKTLLEHALAEQQAFTLQSRGQIAISQEGDPMEKVASFGDRERIASRLKVTKKLIDDIQHALTKFTNDEFGICEKCGECIEPKRLDAVPWAKHCVRCADGSAPATRPASKPKGPATTSVRRPDNPDVIVANSNTVSVFDRIVDSQHYVGLFFPAHAATERTRNNRKRPCK